MDKLYKSTLILTLLFLTVLIISAVEIHRKIPRLTKELSRQTIASPVKPYEKPKLEQRKNDKREKSIILREKELEAEKAFRKLEETSVLSASSAEENFYPKEEIPLFPGWEEGSTPEVYPPELYPPGYIGDEYPPLP